MMSPQTEGGRARQSIQEPLRSTEMDALRSRLKKLAARALVNNVLGVLTVPYGISLGLNVSPQFRTRVPTLPIHGPILASNPTYADVLLE